MYLSMMPKTVNILRGEEKRTYSKEEEFLYVYNE